MKRIFSSLKQMMEWRNKCPLCDKDLEFELKYNYKSFAELFGLSASLSGSLSDNNFKQVGCSKCKTLNSKNQKFCGECGTAIITDYKTNFNSKTDKITLQNEIIDVQTNTIIVDEIEVDKSINFVIDASCEHDIGGKVYQLHGFINYGIDFEDEVEEFILDGYRKTIIPLGQIEIYYETFKVINVYLDEEVQNGNVVKITNDYSINKTSFSISEVNLDGTQGAFREKRIDLVKDDFFKFKEPKKVYSRANALFLLK